MILTPKQLIAKVEQLKGLRGNWEDHWQELADYHMPRKATVNSKRTPGDKRNTHLLDNTGMKSLEKLAGALQSMLTNPNVLFFELTTGDDDLDSQDEVRGWLQKASKQMHSILNNTNFQTQIHELYLDLCCFGTAAMFIEEDDERLVRFRTTPIEEVVIDENSKGRVNQLYRIFDWNAQQLVEEFGKDNVGEDVLKAFLGGENPMFTVYHGMYPEDVTNSDGKLISQYVLKQKQVDLRTGRFNEVPFVTPRWSKTSKEKYGRSPAMTSLPEMKTLNKMMETTIKGAQKVVDPPLMVPDDGFINPIRTRPGSLNYYRANGSGEKIESFANDARIDFGFQMMAEKRDRIEDAFFVNQLNLREGDRMTTVEVLQRTEESMRLLGPVLGRQEDELLRPMVNRVFSIMIKNNKFDQAPPELEEIDLQVKYSSLIARAQRLSESQNILRGVEGIAPFLQIDPTVADGINGDGALKIIARTFNWPQEMINSTKDIKETREARASAQEEQVAAQQQADQAEVLQKSAPALQALQQG